MNPEDLYRKQLAQNIMSMSRAMRDNQAPANVLVITGKLAEITRQFLQFVSGQQIC